MEEPIPGIDIPDELGLQRFALAHDPGISLLWPHAPSYNKFDENKEGAKKSSVVPWPNISRTYYQANDGKLIFYATFITIPDSVQRPLHESADYMRSGENPIGKPTVWATAPIMMSKWPAWEIYGRRPNGHRILEKLVVIGNQLGLIGVDCPKDQEDDPRIMRFLISLQVKE